MFTTVLPPGSRARSIASAALALLVSVIALRFVLPGTPGGGRGTPMAILFVGFVNGCAVAITAIGMVLVYRSLRIINFAQAAIGAAGGRLFFEFIEFTKVPFLVALPLSVAFGGLIGIAFDLLFGRKFFRQPRIVLTVTTIAALPFFVFVSTVIPSLPIFPRTSTLTSQEQAGAVLARPFLPFAGWVFKVGGYNSKYGFPEVLSLELLVFAVLGLAVFLRFTRSGVAIRGLAENSERASLLGIPVGNLSTLIWALAGVLSTLTVICVGSLTAPSAAVGSAAFIPLLIAPLTAAVVARFQSISVAVFAALLLAVVSNAVQYSYPDQAGLIQVGFFVILTAALLLQSRGSGRTDEGAGVSWDAVREPRPIPRELARIASVRTTRYSLIAVALGVVVIYPIVTPARLQVLGATILLFTIIGISLVVLTGWAGQISLGQFGFAAVGAVIGGALTDRVGIPFWFAVPMASAVAGGVAVLVGLPALRIKGLFLGVSTLAFSIMVDSVLFNDKYFGWLLPKNVDRPTLFFLNFDQERPMYYLCLVCLIVAIVVTVNLRRSRFGRLLIAMRENEANVQSFGVSATWLKLKAFAVSGALAGFAGAVFVHQQRGLSAESFSSTRSVLTFVFTVLGGVGTVGGALLGSLYDNLLHYFLPGNDFLKVVANAFQAGGGPLLVLFVAPAGLISVVVAVRDAWLRIVAQRRQLVVPSLFADYDPTAVGNLLIPLADPDANTGLAALGAGARFRLGSELHGGRSTNAARSSNGREQERAAIGAAANALGDADAATPDDVVGAMLAASREEG